MLAGKIVASRQFVVRGSWFVVYVNYRGQTGIFSCDQYMIMCVTKGIGIV